MADGKVAAGQVGQRGCGAWAPTRVGVHVQKGGRFLATARLDLRAAVGKAAADLDFAGTRDAPGDLAQPFARMRTATAAKSSGVVSDHARYAEADSA